MEVDVDGGVVFGGEEEMDWGEVLRIWRRVLGRGLLLGERRVRVRGAAVDILGGWFRVVWCGYGYL